MDVMLISPYSLRPACPEDNHAIRGLIESVLKAYGITTDLATTDQDLLAPAEHYIAQGGLLLVLEYATLLIGTVALTPVSEGVFELCRMYVATHHRGQGLGRHLLNTALAEAAGRGVSRVQLKTASVLTEAIALYRSAGFALAPGESRCGKCDLVMFRQLP